MVMAAEFTLISLDAVSASTRGCAQTERPYEAVDFHLWTTVSVAEIAGMVIDGGAERDRPSTLGARDTPPLFRVDAVQDETSTG